MTRTISIVAVIALIVSLPFVFRRPAEKGDWRPGDPVVVVITPHNEAIRYEFGRGFSEWHRERFGRPVKVDWRTIGGTTEIMRYLAGEYVSSVRAWRSANGQRWPQGGADAIFRKPAPDESDQAMADLQRAFRNTDDPSSFSCGVDVLFGGGSYDHGKAAGQGLTVPPWNAASEPAGILRAADGRELIPETLGGEVWRTPLFYGTTVSTFGICYNLDRLVELGVSGPPRFWQDLADPAYIGQIGVADPTKSGSIAKAFEMIVHDQCRRAVDAAGFAGRADDFEARIKKDPLPQGALPEDVPAAYQDAVEAGWLAGLHLIQRIGANARYFTDSAGKVPIDVGVGDAAAGLAIDFYARYQAQVSGGPGGRARMDFVTPQAGSSVSADPVSLLRGAPNREIGVRFIEFTLSEAGQRLWNYAPGSPGGPVKFALRRVPIRRDFYPSEAGAPPVKYDEHRRFCVDPLGDPGVNPYAQAAAFTYRPRWTARHFSVLRDIVRAMCIDSGEELRAAWRTILDAGGPVAQPEAMAALREMPLRPEPLTWKTAIEMSSRYDRERLIRDWAACFRENYRRAQRIAAGEERP
jgi:ABC-type Fe3+ transport system substrate-binding protein